MNILARGLVLATLALSALAGCASSNSPVNGLGMIPGGVYTPGGNVNPLSQGMITSER